MQSVSSARSTASRENDFVFKASGAGYSNGNHSQVWPFAFPILCRHKVDCSKFRRFTSCRKCARPACKHQVVRKVMCSSQAISHLQQTSARHCILSFTEGCRGHPFDILMQQPATEPRGSMSDAGILMDLDSSPSAPAGTGASGFPDQGPAATAGASGMPSAAAGVSKASSQYCTCHSDQLSISMSLGLGSGICLKSVDAALRCSLLPLLPGASRLNGLTGLSGALKLLPARLMQLLNKPSPLDGQPLRSPRQAQAQLLPRPQYHTRQPSRPPLRPSSKARLKHSQDGRPLMPRHYRHLLHLHLLRQPLKPT